MARTNALPSPVNSISKLRLPDREDSPSLDTRTINLNKIISKREVRGDSGKWRVIGENVLCLEKQLVGTEKVIKRAV